MPAHTRTTVNFGGDEELDEQLAPLLADLRAMTDLELIGAQVSECDCVGEETHATTADFMFESNYEASKFISLLGTAWPEQQESMLGCDTEAGWYYDGSLFPVEVQNDEGEPCPCGSWHVLLTVIVSVPLSTVDEFTRRIHVSMYSEGHGIDDLENAPSVEDLEGLL
jgi:hypothetical protein